MPQFMNLGHKLIFLIIIIIISILIILTVTSLNFILVGQLLTCILLQYQIQTYDIFDLFLYFNNNNNLKKSAEGGKA